MTLDKMNNDNYIRALEAEQKHTLISQVFRLEKLQCSKSLQPSTPRSVIMEILRVERPKEGQFAAVINKDPPEGE